VVQHFNSVLLHDGFVDNNNNNSIYIKAGKNNAQQFRTGKGKRITLI